MVLSCLYFFNSNLIRCGFHTSGVISRARQATRERKRKVVLANIKAKADRERKNPPKLPLKVLIARGLDREPVPPREPDEKPWPTDDVFSTQTYSYPRFTVQEAIELLREHYQPSVYDMPDGLLSAKIEFNLRGVKKDRYLDGFAKMVCTTHNYDRGVPDKRVVVFAKESNLTEGVLENLRLCGASLIGGVELIQEFAKGRIETADYDHFVAHDDVVLELKPLSGILREKLPKKQNGTLGTDLTDMVNLFSRGERVEIKKVPPSMFVTDDPSYGFCGANFGRLSMDTELLNDNLTSILEALHAQRPNRRDGLEDFITRCQLFIEDGVTDIKNIYSVCHPLIYDKRFTYDMVK